MQEIYKIGGGTTRNSNLELYRIIVMLLIVAHHSVVNSGLFNAISTEKISSVSTYAMLMFGAWGKTGINCFVFITGYFMCRSQITLRKFVKLYTQILFYSVVISVIFLVAGVTQPDFKTAYGFVRSLIPVYSLTSDNFTSCFLVFWLFIPFLNILVQHLDKRQHRLLIILSVFFWSVMSVDLCYNVAMDYVGWFSILYFISSYVRFYPETFARISHRHWGALSVLSILAGAMSVIVCTYAWLSRDAARCEPFYFVADSNQIFALLIGFTTFMWFKDLDIRQSRIINLLGGATFGVLLIHAHSDTMRQWLWFDTIDMTGHYHALGPGMMLLYSAGCVAAIFMVCALVDIARSRYIEPWLNPKVERLFQSAWHRMKRLMPAATQSE